MRNRKRVPIKEMYRRRAAAWEYHYKRRELAKTYSAEDRAHIFNVIRQQVPQPIMLADGNIMDGIATLKAQATVKKYLSLVLDRSYLCQYYWSDEGWMELVRQYQNLPDIYEDYFMVLDEENDAMILLTLGETLGKVRGNYGETPVLSPAMAEQAD